MRTLGYSGEHAVNSFNLICVNAGSIFQSEPQPCCTVGQGCDIAWAAYLIDYSLGGFFVTHMVPFSSTSGHWYRCRDAALRCLPLQYAIKKTWERMLNSMRSQVLPRQSNNPVINAFILLGFYENGKLPVYLRRFFLMSAA